MVKVSNTGDSRLRNDYPPTVIDWNPNIGNNPRRRDTKIGSGIDCVDKYIQIEQKHLNIYSSLLYCVGERTSLSWYVRFISIFLMIT